MNSKNRRIVAIAWYERSIVIKARILPEAFIDWCLGTNQRPNVSSRTRHVNLAIEDYCSSHSASATTSHPREIA